MLDTIEPIAKSSSDTLDATLQERFDRNLAAFERALPQIAAIIKNVTMPQCELTPAADGYYNLKFQDQKLYPEDVKAHVEKQLEDYWRYQRRLHVTAPDQTKLDPITSAFVYRCMRKGVDENYIFYDVIQRIESFHFVVYGVGLGYHLDEIIERSQCQMLILLEPNAEFLRASLYIVDWVQIFDRFSGPGRKIWIICHPNNYAMSMGIRTQVRVNNVTQFEGTHHYQHYFNAEMELAFNASIDSSFYILGLGHFDDEQVMIKNTTINLARREHKIIGRGSKPVPVPAFIIGSGPSLDKDIEFLKANTDRAIFISCSSSLRPLLQAGITPNFHIEIENAEINYMSIAETAKDFSLKGIFLLASSTVNPRLFELFDDGAVYFRRALTSYNLYAEGNFFGLEPTGPTVVNGAVTFTIYAGFQSAYLFGCDMGTKDPKRHHSTQSLYYTEDAPLQDNAHFVEPAKGNFGGVTYTYYILNWTKDVIEHTLHEALSNIKFYNCSDGALIKYALPKRSSTITLPDLDGAAAFADLVNDFPTYSRELFKQKWQIERLIDECNIELDLFCDLIRDGKSITEFGPNWMSSWIDYTVPSETLTYAKLLFRGTVMMMMLCGHYFIIRINDPDRFLEFETLIKNEIIAGLEEMRGQLPDYFAMVDKLAHSSEEIAFEW